MIKSYLMLLMIALTGCASAEEIEFELFRSDLTTECMAQMKRWTAATGLTKDCNAIILEWDETGRLDENLGARAYTQYTFESGAFSEMDTILFQPWIVDRLPDIMAHELGHLLSVNSGHPEDGSVMFWALTDNYRTLNEADLMFVCEHRECTKFEPEP